MKKLKLYVWMLAAAAMWTVDASADDYTVASPDNSLVATVRLADGKLSYSVKKDGKLLVSDSPLGLATSQGNFTGGLELVSQNVATLDETYTLPVGKKSTLRNHFNQLTVTVKSVEANWNMTVLMRLYDDGFAYRYVLPKKGSIEQVRVTGDAGRVCVSSFNYCLACKFNNPGDYCAPNYAYESNYGRYTWADLYGAGKDSRMNTPALVNAGGTFMLLSEAANVTGTCTALLKAESARGEFSFACTGNTKDYLEDKEQSLLVSLPMKSPWKMCIVGTLAQVFESVMTENLCDKTSLTDLSWIRPGVASWDWGGVEGGSYSPLTRVEADYRYVDLAVEMGWPYILVDAGVGLADTKKVVDYARERGVEVLYWQTADLSDSQDFSSPNITKTLDAWKAAGIRGVKIDFWEDDSRSTMDRMEKVLVECGKREMLVNFHGCTRPCGLRRTYPHLMTQEGIMGGEQNFWNNRFMTANHHVNLFFTRNVVGAADYTPGDLANRKGILLNKTSVGHRMALLTAFESGIQHIAEQPEHLRYFVGRDIMKRLPAAWDDSKLVEGSVGSFATIARRHGQDWWIASVSVNSRYSTVPLTFLEPGKTYTAYIYKDGNCRSHLEFEKREVTSETSLRLRVAEEGGYLIQVSPLDNLDVPAEVTYEAEASGNTLSTGATVASENSLTYASGGKKVGNLGLGRLLTFNGIEATQGAGDYVVTIYYTTADDRKAELLCNGTSLGTATFGGNGSTYSASGMGWYHQVVTLHAGSNNTFTLQSPSGGWSPDIDRITVAPLCTGATGVETIPSAGAMLPADAPWYRLDGTAVSASNASGGLFLVPSPKGGYMKKFIR